MIKNPGSVFNVDEVKIGPVTWQITPLALDEDDNPRTQGRCSSVAGHKIQIESKGWNDPKHDIIDTVIHEILHALDNTYFCNAYLTETQVSILATAFENFILDNPKFMLWLHNYSNWVRQERKKLERKKVKSTK